MLRVLSNLPLPCEGHTIRTFGDYRPPASNQPWTAEKERRDLAAILPLIPSAEKPDALIISSPEYLPIPCDVATFPGLRILLITDWNMCLRFLPDLCTLFDYCFVDWPGYRLLRNAGVANVHHQPLFGHDPAIYRNLESPGHTRNLEVSFCGNLNAGMHRERNRLLARLGKWGAGRSIHLGQAFGSPYVDILNRSRLVFNYSIRGEANMRLYEAMACGAVPLVEAGNQEAPLLFQPDRHYFTYEPQRLEARLESLLADPDRIAAVAREAVQAVAGHTKARQIAALLDFAGRDTPLRPIRNRVSDSLCAPGDARMPSADAPASAFGPVSTTAAKALVKMRVLGAAYTLAEAISELQARESALPGLGQETLPAALLQLIESNPQDTLPTARAVLDRSLEGPDIPAPIRAWFRLRRHVARGQWPETLHWSDRCLAELAALEAAPVPAVSLYAHFHPPLGLGKGMNTDLNRAFREDVESGLLRSYLDLLRSHCHAARARALLSLDRGSEAKASAERIAKCPWVSLDPYLLLHDIYTRLDDRSSLRAMLPGWFAETPLDWTMWDKVAESLQRIGDRPSLIAFLEEILALARAFLKPDQAEAVRARLERERALAY
ncbi:MAG: glycosyltransferase [Fibrobacteria bacterium]